MRDSSTAQRWSGSGSQPQDPEFKSVPHPTHNPRHSSVQSTKFGTDRISSSLTASPRLISIALGRRTYAAGSSAGSSSVNNTSTFVDGYNYVLFENVEADGSGNSITQPGSVTGVDGVATGAITSTVAEWKVVKATIDGSYVADTLEVLFEPGELDHFVITHDMAAIAGSVENINFEVRDSYNNLIQNFDDTITIYTNTTESLDRISWGIGTATGTILSENNDTLF